MSLNNQIYISSLYKQIQNAKVTGKLDTRVLYLFDVLDEYEQWTRGFTEFAAHNLFIKKVMRNLKFRYPKVVCNYSDVLPKGSYATETENGYFDGSIYGGTPVDTNPTLANFTVQMSLSDVDNDGDLEYVYTFNKSDLLNSYEDLIDDDFFQVRIDRTDLDTGSLKYVSNGSSVILGENASNLTLLASDLNNLSFYTDDTSQTSHQISISAIDKDRFGKLWVSNIATLTMSKTAINNVGNQPATIGDNAIKVGNQITTTLTLSMFTSGLTPPYNDPEADLIDAIRIDEISTANVGEFRYDGSPIVEGQIITREDLQAGLFTHVGASSNDIETDSFNFSARDEGSGIWVK